MRSGTTFAVDLGQDKSEDLPDVCMRIERRVLHPSSARRLLWDLIGLMLIAYDVAVIPLQFFDPLETDSTRLLAWFSRVFWTIDIPTGFFTGFLLSDGDIEMRLVKIARRYIRSWLTVDIIVVLFDWVDVTLQGGGVEEIGAARMGKTMRIMRMLRIVRLIRVAKLPLLAGTWLETYIRSEKVMLVASMAKLMLFIITLMHFIACVWYGIGDFGGDDGWILFFEGRAPKEEDLTYR